ncbi:MAG: PfkB family carbohydrate kinase [Spirochaetaceae bacterium]|jgi:1-phosphofructokinase/tagatose 6-phosphate kinase|nr:PfkB family carbohydrate kinase [Spirochaetaceae bacterium]
MNGSGAAAFLSVCMNPTFQKTLCFHGVSAGMVNRAFSQRLDVSGKGINVSRVLSQLGKKAVHLTHLGGDLRELFLRLCEKDGLDIRWVESGSGIRFCYTVITGEGAGRTVTELVEEGDPVAGGTGDRLLAKYRELLPGSRAVIISGSKAQGYDNELVPEMTRLAGEAGKPVTLDVRGSDLVKSLPFRPALIKPNLFEFAETFAPEFKSLGELSGEEEGVKERIRELALGLCAEYHTGIVLSRGGGSVWYFDESGMGECPVEKRIPVNTIGSGDAFSAGLSAALFEDGLPFAQAVAQGVHCGSLNAGFLKPGVIRDDMAPVS